MHQEVNENSHASLFLIGRIRLITDRTLMPPMQRKFLKFVAAAALFVYCASVAAVDSTNHKFFSWYNGWGSHKVWGLGSITGSYSDASVKCGEELIKVVPIYDTHASSEPPNNAQSSAFAKIHNLTLADELAKKGIQCAFEKMSPD